jgi:secondary thiamine-phosphate synthase enzyme
MRRGSTAQFGEKRYCRVVAFFTHELTVPTRGKGLYPFTREVAQWLASTGVASGLLTVFIQHTSASLVMQENADPDVMLDLAEYFDRIVPEGQSWYRHTMEGPDDMTSHIRSALTQTSIAIPVVEGRMTLGTWQGLYVFEHRRAADRRRVVLQLMG